MTPQEALSLLATYAERKHRPGCPKGRKDYELCECGAGDHNAKVKEAVDVILALRSNPPPTALQEPSRIILP